MNIERHRAQLREEVHAAVLEEIKARYQAGVAYLSFGEVPALFRLWRQQNDWGSESVQAAFHSLLFTPGLSEYLDGTAIGHGDVSSNMLNCGLFWNFKQGYQIFDDASEFGPQPSPHRLLDEAQRQTLSDALSHDSEIGSFVFAAMKYVAVARSLRKTKFSLSEHRYFRMFKENETLIPTATECLQGLVDTTVTLRTVRPRLLNTSPALYGGVDVDITLKLFQS